MRDKKDIRLFFALWPNCELRGQISTCLTALSDCDGRAVPNYNWHMTLHFIGNTTFAEKNCLHKQAQVTQAAPFDLTIDSHGYFKKPRVFWLGCEQPPEALFNLQKNLGMRLSRCEYQPEARPFMPHITVARKVPQAPDLKLPGSISWHVDRFVLIESVPEKAGVRYKVMEEYLLR